MKDLLLYMTIAKSYTTLSKNFFTLHHHVKIRRWGGCNWSGYQGAKRHRKRYFLILIKLYHYESSPSSLTMKNLQTITSFRTQHFPPTTIWTKHHSANTHGQSAHTGTFCHTASDKCPNTWIIDSGASTRMTRNSDTSSWTWHFWLISVIITVI